MMTAIHEHTIRLPVLASRVQLASNGTYLALPHARGIIKVWSLQDITCKALEFEGHRKTVTGLAFGQRSRPTLLCSAAEDFVIVWNIERARTNHDTGQQIRGTVIGTTLGYIQYVAFNTEDSLVAVCTDRKVIILDSTQERVTSISEGHEAMVNCAEFCPHHTSTLVSVSDDRTFKIWDLSAGSLVYQSTIISSSPFISLTMNPLEESMALGTADGQVRVYDLTDGNGFRCLQNVDVAKTVKKIQDARDTSVTLNQSAIESKGPVTISSRRTWQKTNSPPEPTQSPSVEDHTEMGCSILALVYTFQSPDASHTRSPTPAKLSFLQRDDTLVNDLLESAPMLVIGTTSAILQVNAKTLEPMQYISLQEPMASNSVMVDGSETVQLAGNMFLSPSGRLHNKVCAIVGSLFKYEVHILNVFHPTQLDADVISSQLAAVKKLSITSDSHGNQLSDLTTEGATGDGQTEELSVLSCSSLLPNSPLKAELLLKTKESKVTGKLKGPIQRPGLLNKKGQIVDQQPIVFHNKVKSSGYTKDPPRTKMFQPKTNTPTPSSTPTPPILNLSKTPTPNPSVKKLVKEYPMNSDPPIHIKTKIDVAERPTAINTVRFSDDGQHVACALSNTSTQVFKMPLTGKGSAFTGHRGIVTSARWSHDSRWILTSSDDKTAAVWSLGLPDPVMTLSFTNNNFGVDKEGGLKPDKENAAFSKPVKFGQFYYMDKFILLTAGNIFSLYKYHLDTSKSDIKRYLSNNRYKLVKSFQMTDSQQITAFSAINSFHSYLVLCAGTNKSVEVFDLNAASSVRIFPDTHTRAPHVICQNQGSAYVSHSSSAYDLFVTAAAADSIKLWDLRSNRCVRRYEGHCNRSQPCGLAFSPCSRYIATGSEDRSAYLFDIRSGTYLHKVTGHTDTVSDVAFHPLYPQLLTATLDGKLRLFTDK